MILGFAHLTLTTNDATRASAVLEGRGWKVRGQHRGVPSAPEKWPLLAAQATRHDLTLLDGPLTIEVIEHDTGTRPVASQLTGDADGVITLQVKDPGAAARFITQGLGFEAVDGDTYRLSRPLAAWSASIRVTQADDAPSDPPLDVEGYSCIAFYSNDPEGDAARLGKLGAHDVTRPFDIELGGRQMQVLMLRGPEGTIYEFIKVKVRK